MARDPWDGGYKHRQKDGKTLFIIERRVGKDRFHISTRAHSETAAYEHLRRFEADPWKYAEEMKHGRNPEGGVFLTGELILEFRTWLLSRKPPAPPPTTRKHANEMAHRLTEWAEDLTGRDLRKIDLATLKDKVAKRGTCTQHRIIAIKGFCAWLRTEKMRLDRHNDATLDLLVPQAQPEKHRRKKAQPVQSVRKVLPKLRQVYRDCLLVLAHTGWHVTELHRFARDEHSAIVKGRGKKVLGVLVTWHKGQKWTRTPILEKDALEAAERLRERGCIPRRLNAAIRAACRAAKVPEFTAGVMRHTVGTWAVEQGTPEDDVSQFLDHEDKRTTRKFYIDAAVPTRSVKLPKLRVIQGGRRKRAGSS